MSIFDKVFKKSEETHLPNLPAEYREDYQKHMARKGVSIQTPEDKIPDYGVYPTHEEVQPIAPVQEVVAPTVDMSSFDALAELTQSVTSTASLESINDRLEKLEKLLKDRGYI